jgi:hypothetical protein
MESPIGILSIFSILRTEAREQLTTLKDSVHVHLGAQGKVMVELQTEITRDREDYMYLSHNVHTAHRYLGATNVSKNTYQYSKPNEDPTDRKCNG